VPEIDAARSAGFRTCLCVRDNGMATPHADTAVVRTFDEIAL
jgi:methionine salvage enolase-phosphatase E1